MSCSETEQRRGPTPSLEPQGEGARRHAAAHRRQPPVVILGYGNPLRADDGIGWAAAEVLEQRLDPDAVEVIASHLLTPELAARVAEAAVVIFIDAACDLPPGQVVCKPVQATQELPGYMTHSLGPQSLLALASQWYRAQPLAHVFAVGGEDWSHSERLSPRLQAVLPDLVEQVCGLVGQYAGPGAVSTA